MVFQSVQIMAMKTIISSLLAVLFITTAAYAIDANDRHGIKGISMSINGERMHRSGDEVQFNLMVTNSTSKDENNVALSFMDSEVVIDGDEKCPIDGKVNWGAINLPANETTGINTWISKIPLNAEMITSIKLVGRAPDSSKSTDNNPYGNYDYRFTNISLPAFLESNKPGCVFYDNEILLNVGETYVNGKDLVVEFMLTNKGRKDYSIRVADYGRGSARTAEGEEYQVSTQFPSSLPVGEPIKGQIVIKGGADEIFSTVRQGFNLSQNSNQWNPGLLLRNISKQ